MLIPKEQPYLVRLNSYYLHFEKFVEHLQGEIGSGCLYCQAAGREILVYFDEQEIVRGVIQETGQHAQVSQDLDSVLQMLSRENFLITVYYLDATSIFYWSEIPSFRRNKATVDKTQITLPNLVIRFQEMSLSGFVDIELGEQDDSVILFFHEGERLGGSYSWGEGGMSSSEEDYNRLLDTVEAVDTANFAIGYFATETVSPPSDHRQEEMHDELDKEQYFSDLETAVKEFLILYIRVAKKKIKAGPIIELKQNFLDSLDEYPSLDLFKYFFQLSDNGTISFAADVNRKEIVIGIVACTWMVIRENKLEKKFRTAVNKWDYKSALEERGILVIP